MNERQGATVVVGPVGRWEDANHDDHDDGNRGEQMHEGRGHSVVIGDLRGTYGQSVLRSRPQAMKGHVPWLSEKVS